MTLKQQSERLLQDLLSAASDLQNDLETDGAIEALAAAAEECELLAKRMWRVVEQFS